MADEGKWETGKMADGEMADETGERCINGPNGSTSMNHCP